MIWSAILKAGLAFATLNVLLASAAAASCEQKSRLIDSLYTNVVDLANSSNPDRKASDHEAIRSLSDRIVSESCPHPSAEMARFTKLAAILRADLDALQDYYHERKPISKMPIQQRIAHWRDSADTNDCRCYARRAALAEILYDMRKILADYAADDLTPRDAAAAYAWFRILNRYLYDTIGISVKAPNAISSEYIEVAFIAADVALKKHCHQSIFRDPVPAGGCAFATTASAAPSSTPSPSPSPSPTPVPSPTPAPTPTETPSPSPSPSPVPTTTPSPSRSRARSVTPTPSPVPTATPTETPSPAPTATETATPGPTETPAPSPSPASV